MWTILINTTCWKFWISAFLQFCVKDHLGVGEHLHLKKKIGRIHICSSLERSRTITRVAFGFYIYLIWGRARSLYVFILILANFLFLWNAHRNRAASADPLQLCPWWCPQGICPLYVVMGFLWRKTEGHKSHTFLSLSLFCEMISHHPSGRLVSLSLIWKLSRCSQMQTPWYGSI